MSLAYNNLYKAPELVPVKPTLLVLRLAYNQLVRFPNEYFEGFLQLEYLDIQSNHLEVVPALGWLTSTLERLDLSHNRITSLEGLVTQVPFKELDHINLGTNNIRTFDVGILRKMPNLSHLSLARNDLKGIDDYRHFFSYIPDVSGNPFHCDPAMAWAIRAKGWGPGAAVCATPWCRKGHVISNMCKYS